MSQKCNMCQKLSKTPPTTLSTKLETNITIGNHEQVHRVSESIPSLEDTTNDVTEEQNDDQNSTKSQNEPPTSITTKETLSQISDNQEIRFTS